MWLSLSYPDPKPNLAVFLYALPGVVMAMPLIPVIVIIPAYYADNLGLGLAQTGLVLLMARILDFFTDPAVGWATENSQRRYANARKIQIGIGVGITGFALFQLFTPSVGVGSFYLFFWYSLMLFGWTVIQVPYLAWIVDLTGQYEKRVSYNAAREFSGIVGILILGAYLAFAAEQPVSEQLRGSAELILFLGLAAFPFLFFLRSSRKKISTKLRLSALKTLRKNRLFLRLMLAWFLNSMSIGVATACFPLFVKYGLGLEESTGTYLLFLYFSAAILGMPIWYYLCRIYGKHSVWGYAMIIACLAFLVVPFLSTGSVVLFGLVCLVTGITVGADLVIPPSIQADVSDWDSYSTGEDRASLLFSLWSMVSKLALGVGAGSAYLILGQPETSADTAEMSDALNLLLLSVIYAVVPIVLKVSSVAIMWRFPLDARKHNVIRNRLERRAG